MKSHEFFAQPELSLPGYWKDDLIIDIVDKKMIRYCELLRQLDDDAFTTKALAFRDILESATWRLSQSIQACMKGQMLRMHELFHQAMETYLPLVTQKTIDLKDTVLFRVRCEEERLETTDDMFHLPFERREEVRGWRYSIPGLPCLYMAGSIYACWEEMGAPPLHKMQCSAIWTKSSFKVLDLSRPPKLWAGRDLARILPENILRVSEMSNHDIISWPLMAACSIVGKNRNAHFKPEYALPQMLTEHISEKASAIKGIAYFSTKLVNRMDPCNEFDFMGGCNVVIPVMEIGLNGACPTLKKTFIMTEPQRFEFLASLGLPGDGFLADRIKVGDAFAYMYQTAFGDVQGRLSNLARQKNHTSIQ